MKSKLTHPLILIAFGVALFALFNNFSLVLKTLGKLLDLISPILLGLVFAFILHVPMNGFERLLTRCFPALANKPQLSIVSLLLTLTSILLVIVLTVTLVIPPLVSSVQTIRPLLEEKGPQLIATLNRYQIDTSLISEWINALDISSYFTNFDQLFGSLIRGVRSTLSSVTNGAFGLVIAVYLLLTKKTLAAQGKQFIAAYLPPRAAHRLYTVAHLLQETYAKFLSGQCVEAIILGCLIATAFGLCRLPYAALIGLLTGLFAFIPYIGAFGSCAIGAFLILLAMPEKTLWAIGIYVVVQFIENQLIYPRVVGGSVGLSPLGTLLAALLGGKLFGLLGILFCIPLAAVCASLLQQDINQRLQSRRESS